MATHEPDRGRLIDRSTFSTSQQAVGLVAWVAITFAAAAIGAWGSANSSSFYAELARPSWAPPASLFGPVWTTLYVLMAISAWLVWRVRGFGGARTALSLYVVQLGANALWSWLFFAWHRGGLAFVEVLLLWGLIVATVVAFQRISRLASILLYPYLAWVTFASALTFAVWRLNPGLL
jgi:tryptophan-rich sensory protein